MAKELKERVKVLYNYTREIWEGRSEQLGLPPEKRPKLAPILKPDDYWNFLREELRKYSIGKRGRERVARYISELKRATNEVLRELIPIFHTSPGDMPRRFWEMVEERLQERLDESTMRYINRLLARRPELRRLAYPMPLITPSPTSKEAKLRVHLLLDDVKLLEKRSSLRNAMREGWADFLELPHLIYFEPEELSDLLEDEKTLDILLHPRTPDLLRAVRDLGRPSEVVKEVSKLPNPDYVLSRSSELPKNIFHPDILKELRDLEEREIIPLLEELIRIREHIEAVGTRAAKKAVQTLKQDPSITPYLIHPTLVHNADLLLRARDEHPGLLLALREIRKHLDRHTPESVRLLLRAAVSHKDPDLLRLLAPHPDLKDYYSVLAKVKKTLGNEALIQLLENKEKWKGIHPYDIEAALKYPLVIRVLTSDINNGRKREFLESIEALKEEDLELEELAQRYNLPTEPLRPVKKYLRDSAEDFVKYHKDLVASLPRRALITTLLYFKRRGRPLTPLEISALTKLSTAMEIDPKHVVEAVTKMDRETLRQLASVSEEALRGFYIATLSAPDSLYEELKRFLETRREISRRIKVREPTPMEKLLRALEEGIKSYDPESGTVELTKDLRRKLGVGARNIGIKELTRSLLDYIMSELSVSRRRAREILRGVRLDEILERKSKRQVIPDWIPRDNTYHPLLELNESDISRLLGILSSINRAISDDQVVIEGLSKDGKYVVFRAVKNSHDSKVLKDRDFHGYVRTLSGKKPVVRGSSRVYIPVRFFRVLFSHPDLSGHELSTRVNDLIMRELSKRARSFRSSKRKSPSRRK